MLGLDSPLRALKGIGPRRAERLAEAGLRTVEDLLLYLPFRYEDRTHWERLSDLVPGVAATVRARVASSRPIRTRRRGFTIVQAVLEDESGSVRAVWYNQPYLARVLAAGREGFFYGEAALSRQAAGSLVLENPEIEMLAEDTGPDVPAGEGPSAGGEPATRWPTLQEVRAAPTPGAAGGAADPAGGQAESAEPLHTGRVVPIYRSVAGLSSRTLRRLIHEALSQVGDGIEDFLPGEMRRRLRMTWRGSAFRGVHFPPAGAPADELASGAGPFHRRLIFEEFLTLQLGLALRRQEARREGRGFSYRFTEQTRRRLSALLPFTLTRSQGRVLEEIRRDLEGPVPMNRLLQGDVGSGKTVIAALTLAIAAENGLQAAFMAPTEILAAQHFERLRGLLGPAGHRMDLLVGALRAPARRRVLEAIGSGETVIAVGTHALISGDVRFQRLGLIVVDEQHRFGVSQRAGLRAKGWRPDTLVMTATPIPRSLALTVYGDLDHSVVDEMPPGRKTIKTLLRFEEHRERVYEGVRRELERGRQAFIVYPLVEENPRRADLKAAVEMADRLRRGPFAGFTVACVHGRMPRAERDEVMAAFARAEAQVLVATTIVEVGIDVPNATVLLVEHPERFGLSQLHQLRGRVGRSGEKSYCILMAGAELSEEARGRLDALVAESDGFRIAERDMALRGPGDILGTRQHGIPDLRVGHVARDAPLMGLARREATAWVERIGAGQSRLPEALAALLERRWAGRLELGRVG